MRNILGDRLEQSRVRLERDIDNNVPYPASVSSDNSLDNISSVGLARHNSQPQASFHSFEHLSHLDSDFYSRHGDDDSIVLDPDLAHTMSTAAHHASALTLSAGLRGRSNCNHGTVSITEFDPERSLQTMLDTKIAGGRSHFDATSRSKSESVKSLKHDQTRSVPSFDPVVVESTAELDRFLQTGHHHPYVSRSNFSFPYISHSNSQPNSLTSDPSDSDNAIPRLTQALSQQFSPKRPRSAPVSAQQLTMPLRLDCRTPGQSTHFTRNIGDKSQKGLSNIKTTKLPFKRTTLENKAPESHISELVRGVAHDTEVQSRLLSQDYENQNGNDPTSGQHRRHNNRSGEVRNLRRHPFTDIVNKGLDEVKINPVLPIITSTRVRLPDVTGISSAVQSPIKGATVYASADVAHPSLAVDLLPALDGLQTRLQALEHENGVSRRRVKELELELETCKAEVARERTRVREHKREFGGEVYFARERDKDRKVRKQMGEEEARYREAVEEKKALEALIVTLRTHLARVTSELASHKSVIAGLRADAHATGAVQAEVEALRAEVERLAGEVERLKEVVEEGLRERRRKSDMSGPVSPARDRPGTPSQVGIDLTYVTVSVPCAELQERENPLSDNLGSHHDQRRGQGQGQRHEQETNPPSKLKPEPQRQPPNSSQYIEASELVRVESEMRERRSERSLSGLTSSSDTNRRADDSSNGGMHVPKVDPSCNVHEDPLEPSRPIGHHSQLPSNDSNLGSRQRNVTTPEYPAPGTPFPQIRGSRMERLFFSAPEHNVRTCTVCHRRKRGVEQRRTYQPSDERCKEGREDEEVVKRYLRSGAQRTSGSGRRNCADDNFDADNDRLPPQTVLARVLRELEDDFSHYKAIYLELAEQYGVIDAASNVAKRNVLADHLLEVIDTLEQKGDQIASLYDLLNFQDKPLLRGSPPRPKHAVHA